MKRPPSAILRTVVLPLLGLSVVLALLMAWNVGLFQPRLQRLVRQLQTANDAEDRYEAAVELGELGGEARPAIPALVAALQDEGHYVTAAMMIFPREHYVRNAAYQALSEVRGPETVEALIEVIAAGNTSRKSQQLIKDGMPVAVDGLLTEESEGELSSANDRGRPDWYTCSMAARLLTELGPEAKPAAERLLDAIDGCSQGEVVKLSIAALNAMQIEPDSPAAAKAHQVLPQFCNWSSDTGRTAARLLYRLRPDDDEALKYYVRAWLRSESPPAANTIPINDRTVPLLIGHLGDRTREAAMEHLAAAEPNDVVPALREALRRPEWLVRAGAASVLAQHGVDASDAEADMTQLLSDKNATVRQAAAEGLWRCSHQVEAVLPALVAAMDSQDARIRQAARDFVGGRGSDDG